MCIKVPRMRITIKWQPKHEIKFYTTDNRLEFRWLFKIKFSNKDHSLLFFPFSNSDYSIESIKDDLRHSLQCRRGGNIYISLHESGVVNIHTSDPTHRQRMQLNKKTDIRHVATVQFNSIVNLPSATIDEVNAHKKNQQHFPLNGFPHAPVMCTIYCIKKELEWSPPVLGNAMMLHYEIIMPGKAYDFHFVAWQNLNMPKGEGVLAFQFGGENDQFYLNR